MTTLGYGAITRKREEATPNRSESVEAPGVRGYVDALAALVPAEVLALHAVIVPLSTASQRRGDEQLVLTVTNTPVLRSAFFALLGLAALLYYLGHRGAPWQRGDWLRAFIPPVAFVLWTMLQPGSAFDAVAPGVSEAGRLTTALIGAALLGGAARYLATSADRVQVTAMPVHAT